MMCEVMPTIAEDPGAAGVQGDSNFEQVMVNLLDEREKLLETLRETQEQLETNKQKVAEFEKENASLQRQVNENTPQVVVVAGLLSVVYRCRRWCLFHCRYCRSRPRCRSVFLCFLQMCVGVSS